MTWRQAQKQLDSSQRVVLNQMARMKEPDKIKWAEFNKNDYKVATKNWQDLARKNPGAKEEIQMSLKQMQLKMCFSKEILTLKQRKKINTLLGEILETGDDFGSYWGY